jgi:rhodanese-related sulfurtransferase
LRVNLAFEEVSLLTTSAATEFKVSRGAIVIDQVRRRLKFLLMEHSPGFLKVVNEARPRVRELTIEQARERVKQNPKAVLIDVREDREWEQGHAAEAVHLGRGVLERDIEKMYPDRDAELILYCGGGYRSVLAAEMAQKLGYRNVASVIGGYKGMLAAEWPMRRQ